MLYHEISRFGNCRKIHHLVALYDHVIITTEHIKHPIIDSHTNLCKLFAQPFSIFFN